MKGSLFRRPRQPSPRPNQALPRLAKQPTGQRPSQSWQTTKATGDTAHAPPHGKP